MGGRFAPSMANLFMGIWERKYVYSEQPQELITWRRYIDDCFLMWRGSEESLKTFLEGLNGADPNIKLTYNYSKISVDFLDITVYRANDRLQTKTFFKETDRNAYIPTTSNHHKNWVRNIPKGQFKRVRRNCTLDSDYQDQSQKLVERFVEKGYNREEMESTARAVRRQEDVPGIGHNRGKDRAGPQNWSDKTPFITGYTSDHWQLEKIVRQHWPILKLDPVLGPTLPEKPVFIYKKAPNLATRLVHNVVDPPVTQKNSQVGFYSCGKCIVCKTLNWNTDGRGCSSTAPVKQFSSTVTKMSYKMRDFATCVSEGVNYLLECPCHLQYVGRTKRSFKTRIAEHIRNIKRGYPAHSVSAHYAMVHNRDPSTLKAMIIEVVKSSWRGENQERKLACREMHWIYKLKTLAPSGLNLDIELNCFLDDS